MISKKEIQKIERIRRTRRRHIVNALKNTKYSIGNPFGLYNEIIMCSFIELRTVDMFAIIKQWRVKGICKIEEGFSYYDKESKRRIHAGFSEVFNELKLAAYLHQNGVIEKLSRLGYTIRYNAYHEDENE